MFKLLKYKRSIYFLIPVALVLIISACSTGAENIAERDSGQLQTSEEESGPKLALDETYDQVRNGAHLILVYDSKRNSFKGTVQNTTDSAMKQVRVEVHLSNGVELGPTIPTNLNPGEKLSVCLETDESGFDGWTAHPEVGESARGEHGDGEGDSEHDGEVNTEHSEEGSD